MELKIIGEIHREVARPLDDEQLALEESQGCFIFADSKDAVRWTGIEFGGRWKTWTIGTLSQIPMIPWPRINRFHQHRHEADGAYVALKGAIESALKGAPIVERNEIGRSPQARMGVVHPQSGEGTGPPLGVIMMDECHDHDFAVHATRRIACVCASNHDGPRLVSYNPGASVTVATVVGLNARIDHIVLAHAYTPEETRSFIGNFLEGSSPQEGHNPVRIDCMSGVITVFWSRINGKQMLGHYPDPAMGLCNDGLVKAGGAMQIPERIDGLDERRKGPGAYAFVVNPGKWTARWFLTGENGPSALIFSRDGAESFHPELDCSMPGVMSADALGVPTPMEALNDRATGLATEAATDFIDDLIGPYLPAAMLASGKRWVKEKLWAIVSGCASLVLVGLFVGAMLFLAACGGLLKTMMG